ncbi:hypothetical protein FRC03_011031 [Tulasnella sp. 419]|nr:hypothetical protein FRC02_010619 [Tulasnella sp. 418]KAG8955822.1 hypothetical protein FRC03_011031 [Tulasnella sp. 419]
MPRTIIPRLHASVAPYDVPSRSEQSNSPAPTITAESCTPPAVYTNQNAFIIKTHQPSPKSSPFTAAGELYPYVKGKKVSPEQLSQLLVWFAEDDNPSKEQRVAYANQLQMSFKAISIWYQNERANVKKGRSRVPHAAAPTSTPVRSNIRPTRQRSIKRSYSYDSTSDDEEEFTDDGDSEETVDIDTPQQSHNELPRVDVVNAETAATNGMDQDAVLAAHILVRMKYSL